MMKIVVMFGQGAKTSVGVDFDANTSVGKIGGVPYGCR